MTNETATCRVDISDIRDQFESLEGFVIRHVPGSDYAAVSSNGRRNARVWVAFCLSERKELCQLRRDEVSGWLAGKAKWERIDEGKAVGSQVAA